MGAELAAPGKHGEIRRPDRPCGGERTPGKPLCRWHPRLCVIIGSQEGANKCTGRPQYLQPVTARMTVRDHRAGTGRAGTGDSDDGVSAHCRDGSGTEPLLCARRCPGIREAHGSPWSPCGSRRGGRRRRATHAVVTRATAWTSPKSKSRLPESTPRSPGRCPRTLRFSGSTAAAECLLLVLRALAFRSALPETAWRLWPWRPSASWNGWASDGAPSGAEEGLDRIWLQKGNPFSAVGSCVTSN